ncbi:MAG: serine acetyltransferase [Bacteroidales bacterium]|nr:serine acetyltransferase [Bacteroidales bacterium]
MKEDKFHDEIIKTAIEKLSLSESYKMVYMPQHGRSMPSVVILNEMVNKFREILFPGYFGHSSLNRNNYSYHLGVNVDEAFRLLSDQVFRGICFSCRQDQEFDYECGENEAMEKSTQLIAKLPEIRRLLATDVRAAYLGDPAANSEGEVIFSYPTIRAMTNHRIAHELYNLNVPLIPRIISEMAHSETGIDIHPGAKIDEFFAIDHGTGVVIGETAIIGKRVKIYQGVTLGAKSFPLDDQGNPIKGIPRHPVVEDDVIIYSNATILGRISIGKGSVIGGNIWVTKDLPPYSRITQQKPLDQSFSNGGGI